jgi:hypothetical protein
MKKIGFPLFLFFLTTFFSAEGQSAIPVLNIRHWSDMDSTRIVVDLGGSAAYQDKTAADSPALKIQLSGVSLPEGRRKLAINDRLIRTITIELGEKEIAEIQVSLVKATRYKIFTLRSLGDKPDRLVITFFAPRRSPVKKSNLLRPLPPNRKRWNGLVNQPRGQKKNCR